jgi:hypothetical protein
MIVDTIRPADGGSHLRLALFVAVAAFVLTAAVYNPSAVSADTDM